MPETTSKSVGPILRALGAVRAQGQAAGIELTLIPVIPINLFYPGDLLAAGGTIGNGGGNSDLTITEEGWYTIQAHIAANTPLTTHSVWRLTVRSSSSERQGRGRLALNANVLNAMWPEFTFYARVNDLVRIEVTTVPAVGDTVQTAICAHRLYSDQD
jgi:hypothetical protein